MGAPELLRQLRCAGFTLALTNTGLVEVAPASRLSDADRATLRAHRDDLARLLALTAPDTESVGCATCMHRTQAGVCGTPVDAGLAPHFEVFFCDTMPDDGAACPAYAPGLKAWRGSSGALPDCGITVPGDDETGMVSCMNCTYWRPGRCRNHDAAGLAVSDLAAGWHELLQRCVGFKRVPESMAALTYGTAPA